MPWYDYQCPVCHEKHEISHGAFDETIFKCCCGIELNKIITAPPVHFKGSGFPGNDSKGK